MTDQEQLKHLFIYGTATGNFYRKVATCNSVKRGGKARGAREKYHGEYCNHGTE